MERNRKRLRDRLLQQHVPQPGRLNQYRKDIKAMLDREEKILRREKWYAGSIWTYVVLVATVILVLAGRHPNRPVAAFLAAVPCFFLISAGIFLKYFINQSRVELLRELKQIELQVLELKETMRQGKA